MTHHPEMPALTLERIAELREFGPDLLKWGENDEWLILLLHAERALEQPVLTREQVLALYAITDPPGRDYNLDHFIEKVRSAGIEVIG